MRLIDADKLLDRFDEIRRWENKTSDDEIFSFKDLKMNVVMDCIEIPLTELTYRGKHEVRP